MFEYGEWEYHPAYGIFSRLVYQRMADNNLHIVNREYKTIKD